MYNRSPRTQDISWFLDLKRQGKIDLDPPYQRKSVWSSKDRRFFIDTILRNYPSPPIYLCKKIDEKSNIMYEVVDGKQRLETIFLFFDDKIAVAKDFGDVRVDGKKWRVINEDRQFREVFLNYEIIVEHVSIPENVTITINEVFDRLNRNSRKLTEQELRHAKYDGWFINFCEKISDDPFWTDAKVSTKARTKRMRDVQFISELLMVTIEKKVHGFDQNNIDKFYSDYDASADDGEGDIIFDQYALEEKFMKTLSVLTRMEKHNSCISKYASEQKHLYTLWAAVSNADIDADDSCALLAETYVVFMEKVVSFAAALATNDEDWGADEVPANVRRYVSASAGANTDFPQRSTRLDALNEALAILN